MVFADAVEAGAFLTFQYRHRPEHTPGWSHHIGRHRTHPSHVSTRPVAPPDNPFRVAGDQVPDQHMAALYFIFSCFG